MNRSEARICERLHIDNAHFVEIEAKKRIFPEQLKDLKKYLLGHKKVWHEKATFFFDQFLDTPRLGLLRIGASLRLRYKGNGTKVYLQYKGPGYLEDGILYRSEFSSGKLKHLLLEESHHDMIRFSDTSVRQILRKHVPSEMAQAMRRHLGHSIIAQLTQGSMICLYQKDKFVVDLGSAFLEPSLDRIFAFHISRRGTHPLSTFCEFENEIKAPGESLKAKLAHVPEMVKFNEKLAERFDLKTEFLDKYHRCASIFLPHKNLRG